MTYCHLKPRTEPRPSADAEPALPAWGFMEDGRFVAVPRAPLETAGLSPPVTVHLYSGPRHIITQPVCPTCSLPGYIAGECHSCVLARTWTHG